MHVKVTPTDDRPARWLHEYELREFIPQDGGTQIRLLTGEREFVREPPEEILAQLRAQQIPRDPLLLDWNEHNLPEAIIHDADGVRHQGVARLHLKTGEIWKRNTEWTYLYQKVPVPFTIHFKPPFPGKPSQEKPHAC